MSTLNTASDSTGPAQFHIFGRTRLVALLGSVAVLTLCLVFSWTTRDSMAHLPFLSRQGYSGGLISNGNAHVDLRPWLTAQAMAPLAVTAEENEYAHEAERLADHEVDQAFATALRLANAHAQSRSLKGEALAISLKVAQLQQIVDEDRLLVQTATSSLNSSPGSGNSGARAASEDDLEIAKAQLGLDTDVLADAQQNLARSGGDDRTRIQGELAEHEALMVKYDTASHGDGQIAVISAAQHGTLAGRLREWSSQRDRYQLIQLALQQTQVDITNLTTEHRFLEIRANVGTLATANYSPSHAAKLADLNEKAAERQLLAIYDDRIQTMQQLSIVYGNWSGQVLMQHRTLFHLTLQSLALIAFIAVCVILSDTLVQRMMGRPSLDQRRMQTLRTILKLGIQVLGAMLILLVVFGAPRQMPTILGLATAGLTVVLQDFILAFFGWFVLIGKNGIRVGDWVEINGVGGEVTEIGLIRTSLLETGDWTDKGHLTGRRVTFINSFAIRGQYFNFSTTSQWMWDEIAVSLPQSDDTYTLVESIHKAVLEETEKDARIAEQEWKRGTRQEGVTQFTATPAVNLRPTATGIDILVRFVTRASQRFEMRNRLYQRVIDLLHKQNQAGGPKGELVVAEV
jgi:small-conductance mechanosensitive channel